MNAAARLVHQGVLTRHVIAASFMTKRQMVMMVLGIAVLLSALSVIYVTHVTRELYATYQHNLLEQDRLHVQRGQLLLERSTWMMQARIQQIAENKLDMMVPESVVIVRE